MAFDQVRDAVVVGVVVQVIGLVRTIAVRDRNCGAPVISIVGVIEPIVVGVIAARRRVTAFDLGFDVVGNPVAVGINIKCIDNAVAIGVAATFFDIGNAVIVVIGVEWVIDSIPIESGAPATDNVAIAGASSSVSSVVSICCKPMLPNALLS